MHAQPPEKNDIAIKTIADPNSSTCLLQVTINKKAWIIKSVIIFNEALFEGESYALNPN